MTDADSVSLSTLATKSAVTDPVQLLPELRRAEGAPAPEDLSLVDAFALSAELWVGVFADPNGELFAAPFRTAGAGLARVTPGEGAAVALARLVADQNGEAPGGFSLTVFPTGDVAELGGGTVEQAMDVDQTHESVIVGGAAVVKWAVHAESTPAPQLVAHLRAAGFSAMPEPWAFLTWASGAQQVLIASVMGYLRGASDGWTWAVGDATDFVSGGRDLQASLEGLEVVGAVIADMHAAFATPTVVVAAPEQAATADEVRAWRSLAHNVLGEAVAAVDGVEGQRLAALQGAIGGVLDTLDQAAGTPTIPVHGDLHIGQVLAWDGGYAIGDFDGNPVLPVAQRLAPQPAARDVAGMIQSIDHVGRVVLRRVHGSDASRVELWIAEATAAFFGTYRARLADLGCSHLLDDRLLRPFQVEQECREYLYAVRHLPRWRYVPDQALQALFRTV